MTKNDEGMAGNDDEVGQKEGSALRPRLWPAVFIVLGHLAVTFGIRLFGSTNDLAVVAYGATPAVAAILLTLWWFVASRVPMRQRLIGYALFLAVLAWIAVTEGPYGHYLLMIAMPAVTTSAVVVLVLTQRLPWSAQRVIVIATMLSCAGLFTALRVDGLQGDLLPVLSWRWNPSPEDGLAFAESDLAVLSAGTAELPSQVGPHDWPGFRGPRRDGRVTGTTFATNWSDDPPRELWRRPVGLAWSSFAVIGDYAFTQEQRGGDELVVCYRSDTGEEVWANRVDGRFTDVMGDGPRATPTYHEGLLYTQGATGALQCLDASTGKTVWQRDLRKDSGAAVPTWGFSSSPLVTGDLVIVFSGAGEGKSVLAYDRLSGNVAWSAGDGSRGYSSGHLARFAGVPQILMSSNFGLQSFAPETGEILWKHPWDLGDNARVVQPLASDDGSVMIGTSFGKGTRRLKVRKNGAAWTVEEQWTSKSLRPYFNDLVHHEGYCYGFDGNRLTCIDAATGERRWKGERYGGQVLLLADMDILLVLSEKGSVILLEATPEGHTEVARLDALTSKTWNHPVIANGKLFVRNDREAVCYELP